MEKTFNYLLLPHAQARQIPPVAPSPNVAVIAHSRRQLAIVRCDPKTWI
jgi:hypothetical protein